MPVVKDQPYLDILFHDRNYFKGSLLRIFETPMCFLFTKGGNETLLHHTEKRSEYQCQSEVLM